jgi:hypothetical protein
MVDASIAVRKLPRPSSRVDYPLTLTLAVSHAKRRLRRTIAAGAVLRKREPLAGHLDEHGSQ